MIKIRSIMTKEVITIPKNLSVLEAAKYMVSKSVSSLVVVDKDKPVGVISENDIIKAILSKKTKVSDSMNKEFMEISPHSRFSKISKQVRQGKIKRFPVVEKGKIVGLITETDIIEATRDFTRMHNLVQETILAIFGLATAFFLFYFSPLGVYFFG